MRAVTTLIVLLTVAASSHAAGLKPGQTKVLSWKKGVQQSEWSSSGDVSRDGRFVAFASYESYLGGWVPNGKAQIILLDRKTGNAELASRAGGGLPANLDCYRPAISDSGRHVVFYSRATNLAGADPSDRLDVFRFDRVTKVVQRASITYNGLYGNGDSHSAAISGNGRFVAFESYASNMVAASNHDKTQIYVRDMADGVTTGISRHANGTMGTARSDGVSISGDGRYVAFGTTATNLGVVGVGVGFDIVVRDRKTGVNRLASRGHNGQTPNGSSGHPAISANGRFVAFSSQATNLVKKDRGNHEYADLFVYDMKKDRMKEFVPKKGKRFFHANVRGISANGRYVLSDTHRPIFDDHDDYVGEDLFIQLFDTRSGKATVESVNSKGRKPSDVAGMSRLSGNGKYLVFFSTADNLGKDRDQLGDTFIRRRR